MPIFRRLLSRARAIRIKGDLFRCDFFLVKKMSVYVSEQMVGSSTYCNRRLIERPKDWVVLLLQSLSILLHWYDLISIPHSRIAFSFARLLTNFHFLYRENSSSLHTRNQRRGTLTLRTRILLSNDERERSWCFLARLGLELLGDFLKWKRDIFCDSDFDLILFYCMQVEGAPSESL